MPRWRDLPRPQAAGARASLRVFSALWVSELQDNFQDENVSRRALSLNRAGKPSLLDFVKEMISLYNPGHMYLPVDS